MNELGFYRKDLSGEEFDVHNHKYNDMYCFIIPKEEVIDLSKKENAFHFLKNIGINPECYVTTLTDGRTLLVDRKLLETIVEEIPEEILSD